MIIGISQGQSRFTFTMRTYSASSFLEEGEVMRKHYDDMGFRYLGT